MTNKELEKRMLDLEETVKEQRQDVRYLSNKLKELTDRHEALSELYYVLKSKIDKEQPQHHDFKVGDRVQFKSWEELEKEFGLTGEDIDCEGTFLFFKEMKHLCNTYATIENIYGDVVGLCDFTSKGDVDWNYSLNMLKPAIDEPKCKFRVGGRVKVRCYGNATKCTITEINGNKATIFIDETTEFGGSTYSITEDITDLEPYIEPRWTFTDDEKVILRAVSENYNYLVRSNDANDTLWLFENEPTKNIIFWSGKTGKECVFEFYNHLFQSIKWTDDNPCEFRKYL